jgi:two-component system, chemotaxis family, response regulator Rcp1
LIEDNPGDAILASEYLYETSYPVQITIIDDGRKAIDFFENVSRGIEERPDLVLLDLNLPRRTGHEVLSFIRSRGIDVKVVIYSGSKSPLDVKRAEENKADGYLVKPMGAKEMSSIIKELKAFLHSFGSRSWV